jgi:hypothetical protein
MNITRLEPKANSYEFKHLGKTTSLSFEESTLTVIVQDKYTSRTQTVPLDYLESHFVEEVTVDSASRKMVRQSYVLIISALIVFFSSYNESIPLLAPVLMLLGIFNFTVHIKRARPYKWITIASIYNRDLFSIRTVDPVEEVMDRARLKAFLSGLEHAIEKSKA